MTKTRIIKEGVAKLAGTLLAICISSAVHAQNCFDIYMDRSYARVIECFVKEGDMVLNNICATVVHNQNALLLFCQSTLGKFVKITVDKEKR